MAAYGAQPFSIQFYYNGDKSISAHQPIEICQSQEHNVFQIYGKSYYRNQSGKRSAGKKTVVVPLDVIEPSKTEIQWISVVAYGKATVMFSNFVKQNSTLNVLSKVVGTTYCRTGPDTYTYTQKVYIGVCLGLNQVWLSGNNLHYDDSGVEGTSAAAYEDLPLDPSESGPVMEDDSDKVTEGTLLVTGTPKRKSKDKPLKVKTPKKARPKPAVKRPKKKNAPVYGKEQKNGFYQKIQQLLDEKFGTESGDTLEVRNSKIGSNLSKIEKGEIKNILSIIKNGLIVAYISIDFGDNIIKKASEIIRDDFVAFEDDSTNVNHIVYINEGELDMMEISELYRPDPTINWVYEDWYENELDINDLNV